MGAGHRLVAARGLGQEGLTAKGKEEFLEVITFFYTLVMVNSQN